MMVTTLGVGSRCALLLPGEIISPYLTPAKGIVIQKFITSKSLVLVEEIWHYLEDEEDHVRDRCMIDGSLKHDKWGWDPIPAVLGEDKYLYHTTTNHSMRKPSIDVLGNFIDEAVRDFKIKNGFIR